MKLNLTTWQRVMCSLIIGGVQGDIRAFRTGCRLLDVLELSDEDQAAVGFQVLPDGSFKWTNLTHRFELEIEGDELDMLRRHVQSHQWRIGESRVHLREVDNLLEQLGV